MPPVVFHIREEIIKTISSCPDNISWNGMGQHRSKSCVNLSQLAGAAQGKRVNHNSHILECGGSSGAVLLF